jgi:hypothetical protein
VYAVATSETTEGTSGARYTLCWSNEPAANTDYSFEVGVFRLHGPLTQDIVCPMTMPCVVQVSGLGLVSSNKLKVVASGTACSNSAAVPTEYTGGSFDVLVGADPFDTFNLGTTTAGPASQYWHLCWAHDTNYLFDVGTFTISAPFEGTADCTLTETCSITLTGVGFTNTNVLRILESSQVCGTNVLGVSTFTGLSSTTSVTDSSPYSVYAVATTGPYYTTHGTSGTRYKLCWAFNPASMRTIRSTGASLPFTGR